MANTKKASPIVVAALLLTLGFLGPLGCGSIKRFFWEPADRDEWQQPDRVVEMLKLSEGDQVADLGSGGGYFTYRLAAAVGETGRVFALDVDASQNAYVADQAIERKLPQIIPVHIPEDGVGIPDGSVDMIFLSNVFHHLPDQTKYFRRAGSALRPGGRVVVVEFRGDGFPPGHATAPEEIRSKLEAAGYTLDASYDFLEKQSFQIFVRDRESDG